MTNLRRPSIALLALMTIALPISVAVSFMDPASLAMTVLLVVMTGSAGLILVRYRPEGDALTLLTFLAGYYLLAFALGPAYLWMTSGAETPAGPTVEAMVPAMAVATVGWVGLLTGYLVNPLRTIGRVRLPIIVLPSGSQVLVRCVPVFLVGWAARIMTLEQGIYFHTIPAGGEVVSSASNTAITFASTLPTLVVAVVGAYAFADRRKPARPLQAIFLLLLGVEIAWQVPVGSRNSLINLLMLGGVIAYYGRRRVPKKLLLSISIMFVFVVSPLYLEYRGNGDLYQSNPQGSMMAAITNTFSRSPSDFVAAGVTATLSRFSDIESGTLILQDNRDQLLPEAHGESLTWIAFAFLPRFFAPDKPDPGLFGNEVGRVSGMISPADYVTSIAFAQPFELFLALGWLGAGIGMAGVGAVYRLISDLMMPRRHNPLVLALYAVSVLGLTTSLGVIVAHGLVGQIKAIPLYGIVLFFLSGGLARVPAWSGFSAHASNPQVRFGATGSPGPAALARIGRVRRHRGPGSK